MVNRYLNLTINGVTLPAPYYTNNVGRFRKKVMAAAGLDEELIVKVQKKYKDKEVNYGWYRGKGTPEQLEQAAEQLSEKVGLHLQKSKYGIIEFMKLFGIGIDCSGFVYNVFKHALKQTEQFEKFNNSLQWKSEKHNVDNAGVFVFREPATNIVEPEKVQPLDLVIIKKGNKHTHICLILEKEGTLKLAQSSIATKPAGVTVTDLEIKNNKPVFHFEQTLGKDWGELYKKGNLTFRRLSI